MIKKNLVPDFYPKTGVKNAAYKKCDCNNFFLYAHMIYNDTQHNDTQHNNTQHNDTQHNNIQPKDTQYNDNQYWYTQCGLLSVIYAECRQEAHYAK